MNGVGAQASGVVVKGDAVPEEGLLQAPVRLQPEAAVEDARAALERIDRIVKDGQTSRDVPLEVEPSIELHVAKGAQAAAVEWFSAPVLEAERRRSV